MDTLCVYQPSTSCLEIGCILYQIWKYHKSRQMYTLVTLCCVLFISASASVSILFMVISLPLRHFYDWTTESTGTLSHMNKRTAWASCQVRKFVDAHAPGMPGTFSPSPQASDPDMHHGTCVTHVPWCMSGSLTSGFLWNRRRGKTFPAFPAHAQPAILRIW